MVNSKQAATVGGPLGTFANIVSTSEREVLLRWALQAEARHILKNERIADCLRKPYTDTVSVLLEPSRKASHYAGLVTCGSVWMCPVCAAKISERRREELSRAISRCNELQSPVFMATYTFSHTRFDSLSDLLQSFLGAHRRTKQGVHGQKIKQEHGIMGTIRALEVTWGPATGWHPHVHELIFIANEQVDAEKLEADLRHMWERSAAREGLKVNQHGFKLDRTKGAIEDYIAKYGHAPAKNPWGPEAELSKSHIKKGRSDARFTPFGLLLAIHQGHSELAPIFAEYAAWFKGKNQLAWSKGLKLMLLDEQEKTDEEIAAEIREEAILLGMLTREQWHVVLGNDVRGELLMVARSGDWQQVEEFLVGIGAIEEN